MHTCVVNPNHRSVDKTFRKCGTDIYRCRDCGCIMADVDFHPEQYESSDYYTLSHKTLQDIEDVWGFRWRYILNHIVRGSDSLSLLDVGAGNGYFVALAAREFGIRASGIEISSEEIRFAREMLGVELIKEDVARHKDIYDVVTCFNVLEHVPDPRAFLSVIATNVKPGGLLVLTTPNPSCIHARVRSLEKWDMVDPPHHINLFSKKSLHEIMASEHLKVIHYETLSTYINFVRKYDTEQLLLRRAFFNLLRLARVGADHFVMSRKLSV